MPIELTCSGCKKHLRVRDEVAGKRIRCPVCGAVVAVPSPIMEKPVVVRVKRPSPSLAPLEEERVPSEEEGESPPSEEAPAKRRKKRRKRSRSFLFVPLINLFGIDLTPLKLMITAVVLLAAGFGIYRYFTAADAKVRVVDVYNMEDDLGEFTRGATTRDLISLLFHTENASAFVVRENRDGAFLQVSFKLSERTLKKLVGDNYTNFVMKKKDVVLQGDGDPIYPLFMFEAAKDKNLTVKTKSLLPGGDDEEGGKIAFKEPAVEAHQKEVASSEENPWTHPGTLQVNPSGSSEFRGVRGMVVTYTHGPLPCKEVAITWNKGSELWFGVKTQGTPGEIFLSDWRISCLFPRPTSTKNLRLTVLGQPMTMNYP
jgi:hypothetical protein